MVTQFQDENPDLFPIPQQTVAELQERRSGCEIWPRPVAELSDTVVSLEILPQLVATFDTNAPTYQNAA